MEPFDPDMFRFRIRVGPVVEDFDPDAAPTEADGEFGPPLPCRVRATTRRIQPGGPESPDLSITSYDVALPADPGAVTGSIVLVINPSQRLRATGPARARDADGCLWVLPCEGRE